MKGLIPIAQPVYYIMRFAKYKGPEIIRIDSHDKRKIPGEVLEEYRQKKAMHLYQDDKDR